MQDAKRPVDRVIFIQSGLVSLRASAADTVAEIALVGSKGIVGESAFFGFSESVHESIAITSGTALSIGTSDLFPLLGSRPQLRTGISDYIRALLVHSTQNVLCGACHPLEKRLACWLCLASDALGGTVLPVTHDQLSLMLALRRAGITEALNEFEKKELVVKRRGVLELVRRDALVREACCCYPIISRAYQGAIASDARLCLT